MKRADAEEVLGHALALGIDFFDDARYDDETGGAPLASGWSEVLFGELFRAVGGDGSRVTIANKLWWEFWPAQDAVSELSASMERMGLERLGLLYSSTLPGHLSVPTAVEQIAEVVSTGRVAEWAVVNWPADALIQAAGEASRLGLRPPRAAQLPYSLACLDWVEGAAMQSALEQTEVSLVPSAALAGGALTGKYAVGRSGRLSSELDVPRNRAPLAIGAALGPLAQRLEVVPATLAIAFTLLHPRTASTLIGATRPAHIDEAIEAIELASRLSDDDIAELRALTAP
jgi:aryl-alcohol dehydrogenase-like predicted oxidoreductase